MHKGFFLLAILRDDETFDAAEAQLVVAAKSEADSAKIMAARAQSTAPRFQDVRAAAMASTRPDTRSPKRLTPARGRYVDSLPPSLKKAHSDWLDRCRHGTDWSVRGPGVRRPQSCVARSRSRPTRSRTRADERTARPGVLARSFGRLPTGAQFAVDAQRAWRLLTPVVSTSQSPTRCYTDLLWSAVARASRVSKAQKSPPPLVARLVSRAH